MEKKTSRFQVRAPLPPTTFKHRNVPIVLCFLHAVRSGTLDFSLDEVHFFLGLRCLERKKESMNQLVRY